jgi:hypothetical protein
VRWRVHSGIRPKYRSALARKREIVSLMAASDSSFFAFMSILFFVVERILTAWYHLSERIIVGEFDWTRAFERTKIDGLWACKPVTRENG